MQKNVKKNNLFSHISYNINNDNFRIKFRQGSKNLTTSNLFKRKGREDSREERKAKNK